MKYIISIFMLTLMPLSAFAEQGTMTPDDSETRQSEASMSGTTDEELVPQEEEVQLIEKEEYDPMEEPIEIELDQDKMDRYQEDVDQGF